MNITKRLFILISIICTNSFLLFAQLSTQEQLINWEKQAFQREIETLQKQQSLKDQLSRSETIFSTSQFADTLISFSPQPKTNKSSKLTKYGYNFFSNSINIDIWDNKPPQSGYILGTGDEIIIEIWGETQFRKNHIIDQYGKIYVDKIGQVLLTGATLKDAENKLLKKFQNIHSSLKGDQPTAILDVSIGKLKSINVTLLGEAGIPGMHAIHPFSNIITGLLQTGGVLGTGSLRNIQLIRNGKTFSVLDFYHYLLNGNTGNDLRLLDGDIIFIPVRHSTVSIEGEILREAIYELNAGETIKDLIQFAGGFTVQAQKDIRINRVFTMQEHTEKSPYGETVFIDYLTKVDYIMKDGDNVLIYKSTPGDNKVFVYGQVKNPGSFSFDNINGMTLLDLLSLSGGFNDSTFLKTIYLNKGEIIRSQPETTYPQIIDFNIQSLLNGDSDQNIILQNWDIVLIRQNPNFKSPKKVSIMGEVNVPGIYTIKKRWETLDDILNRSGGFTQQAFEDGIQMYRGNEQIALQDFDIVLLDGDSLFVPEHPGVVQILGSVNRPGLVQFDKRKSLSNYIDSAGGYTLEADKKNISIVFANGDVKISKRFLNPRIGEGATIIVQYKDPIEPFNITEYATNLASIITSFATMYLLIENTQRN